LRYNKLILTNQEQFGFIFRLDVITESEDQQSFLGKRQLVSFLSWLDYCDQLIGVANPYVAKALSKSIRDVFLDVIMEPSLLQTSEYATFNNMFKRCTTVWYCFIYPTSM
jgi:hypothetical protein